MRPYIVAEVLPTPLPSVQNKHIDNRRHAYFDFSNRAKLACLLCLLIHSESTPYFVDSRTAYSLVLESLLLFFQLVYLRFLKELTWLLNNRWLLLAGRRGVWMQQQQREREREQHEGPGHEPAGERRRGGGVPNGERGGGGGRARRRRRAAPRQEAPAVQGAVPPPGGELPPQPHPHTGTSVSSSTTATTTSLLALASSPNSSSTDW